MIAKLLAERTKTIMPSTIAPTQSAVLDGCQILDPILIANEVVEDYRLKKKQVRIIKLKLVKAFDRVDWFSGKKL